ncbi:MAG TPA: CatA-like O-acetyltransferase [Thermoanaerobaculia bacterium]|nr:CatA-like O-acetyltransferase [Thermoanaerobaculia bacterium]
MEAGRFIDLDRWKRGEHFRFFRSTALPFFNVCVDVDVTRLWGRSREPGGPSFYLGSVHAGVVAANAIDAMRLRIRGQRVWLHARVALSSTVLRPDETFGFARFAPAADYSAFERAGREEVERAKASPTPLAEPAGDDVVYHSTLPWIRFTGFSNALPLGEDSIPRLVYGKCFSDGERWRMPVAIEVHHALADGLDVARFLEALETSLDSAR